MRLKLFSICFIFLIFCACHKKEAKDKTQVKSITQEPLKEYVIIDTLVISAVSYLFEVNTSIVKFKTKHGDEITYRYFGMELPFKTKNQYFLIAK